MIEHLERHGLFEPVGERSVEPIPFMQSIDDFVESYHSRSGFSRERMGRAHAAAFDSDARDLLRASHLDGMIALQVVGSVVRGFPRG